MVKYTVGFAFDQAETSVILIEKKRPKWQAGKLNGVGGHYEDVDGHLAVTMQREFYEETGVVIPAAEWQAFAVLHGPNWYVRCYRAFSDAIHLASTRTDETVRRCRLENLTAVDSFLIPNLRYLIPLALDKQQFGMPHFHYLPR